MKLHPLLLTGLFTSLFASPIWALTVKDAPIERVTVYPNGALIEREITVQAGQTLVKLEGLAANFDMSGLKVSSQNIDIGSITATDSALDKPSGQASLLLRQEIKQLEQKIAQLNAQIQAAELQNKFLANLSNGQAHVVRQQAHDAFLLISTATEQKKELEQRLNELNQDLNQIGDHRFKNRSLNIQVRAPQSGRIKLAYMVNQATWKPSYKAELNSKNGQLTLTRMASISQKTGEDWNNVALTLSTNTPKAVIYDVSPQPWWVDFRQYQAKMRTSSAPVMEVMAMPAPVAADEAQDDSGFTSFEQVTQTYNTQFTTSKAHVPSSQQQIQLALDQQSIPVKIATWVIPQQEHKAFINASFKRLQGDWPQGEIKLYRDGDFIGQRQWRDPRQDTHDFNFGEDERVQVNVIQHPRQQERAGAFSKTITDTISKQYQITNRHPRAVDLVLFESVPQSQNEQLKVKQQFSLSPTRTEWQKQNHIYQWDKTLNPAESFQLNISYQFSYPNEGGTPTGF